MFDFEDSLPTGIEAASVETLQSPVHSKVVAAVQQEAIAVIIIIQFNWSDCKHTRHDRVRLLQCGGPTMGVHIQS